MQHSSRLYFLGYITYPPYCMSIICCAHGGLNLLSGKLMGNLPMALIELQTDPSLFLFYVLVHGCAAFCALWNRSNDIGMLVCALSCFHSIKSFAH